MRLKLVLIMSLSALVSSCYDVGYEREASPVPETVMENWRSLPKEKKKPTVSFADAEFFMINHCYKINQTLVKNAAVRWDDNTTLYAFMSVGEGGRICVSMISDFKLEVLSADCGGDEKVDQWNNMIATQGL